LTPQRRAVIEELAGNTSHPTAEDVGRSLAERVPGMSLSTVYKVLHELVDLGLIRELDSPGARRFDPDVADHVHVVCDCCGSLLDAALPAPAYQSITDAVSETGANVARLDIVVHGTCPTCNSERKLPA
jgi:Fur family peroxide stress response transcriptional regulator